MWFYILYSIFYIIITIWLLLEFLVLLLVADVYVSLEVVGVTALCRINWLKIWLKRLIRDIFNVWKSIVMTWAVNLTTEILMQPCSINRLRLATSLSLSPWTALFTFNNKVTITPRFSVVSVGNWSLRLITWTANVTVGIRAPSGDRF